MADEDRTEEASPRQLRKARERGEVARSADLSAAAVLIAGLGVISAARGSIADGFRAIMESAFRAAVRSDLSPGSALAALGALTGRGLALVAPVAVVMLAVGGAIAFFQAGAVVSLQALKPKLDKLNVLAGLKRMLMSMSTYVELVKATLKIIVIGALCWSVIRSELRTILMLGRLSVEDALGHGVRIAGRCIKGILLVFVAFAVIDFFWQRFQFRKRLRMSKEQVKQEYKEQEGDPHTKHARKRMHDEISRGKMISAAAKANVIVTNPTHIAIALRYDPDEESAPRLIAKGEGWIAEQIRAIGKQNDIPIVREVTLARTLNELELDTTVPEELYDAVAEVLKWVEVLAMAEGKELPWVKPASDATAANL